MDFIRQVDQLSDDEVDDDSNLPRNLFRSGLIYGDVNLTEKSCYDSSNHGNRLSTFNSTSGTSSAVKYQSRPNDNSLIPVAALSDKKRNIFSFTHFNKMQSICFDSILRKDDNCVISSPTGSGKTVLFELAILRLLESSSDVNNMKVLYIAPTKALCLERDRDWRKKFNIMNLSVGTLTSDTTFIESDKVKKANIIITTPEKLDLMTRRWTDYAKLFGMIRLLLIDEIHILRENRGSTLEVVVTRMKKICSDIRIIALSATVPNILDVSLWVKRSSKDLNKATTYVFGEEYRPVRLEKFVVSYKQASNDFVFDTYLNPKVVEVLNQHCDDKPVLIFCPTRKSTISTAKYILSNFKFPLTLKSSSAQVTEKDLKDLARFGISYHHAGLSLDDRSAVEKSFIDGSTKILCSTSTLAVGINLPAYLVIIKGTKIWNMTAFEEYSDLDVLQMMGRAGRPQYETQGKAVLMTNFESAKLYENLINGSEKLESKLHLNLPENLVSETYLKTISSLQDSLDWLRHTFFYVRFCSNPTSYGEIPQYPDLGVDGRLLRFCEGKLRELIDFGLIEDSGGCYNSTPFGDSMTRHYISFETMKIFIRAAMFCKINDILSIVSRSSELENIRLKRTEKKLLKLINDSPLMKYPLSGTINTTADKIYIMVQYQLGGLEYPNNPELLKLQQTFKQDKFFIFKHAGRLLRCLVDCFIQKGDFVSAKNTLSLVRSINGDCWEDTSIVLRQLSNIGLAAVRRFANHNIKSFFELEDLEPNQIEYFSDPSLELDQDSKLK